MNFTDDTCFVKMANGSVIYSGATKYNTNKGKPEKDQYSLTFRLWKSAGTRVVNYLATGSQHVAFISNYKMFVMGDNTYKQLGIVKSINTGGIEKKVFF